MCLEYPNSWISCPQGILLFTKCGFLLKKYFKKTSNRRHSVSEKKKYEEKPELLAQHTYVTWFWTYFFLTFGKLNVFFLFVWKTSPSSFRLVDLLILSKWTLLPFLALKKSEGGLDFLFSFFSSLCFLMAKKLPNHLFTQSFQFSTKKVPTFANISTFHKLNNENS